MTKKALFTLFVLFGLNVTGCTSDTEGNPQLVQDVQELAQLGCECSSVQCLWDVQVREQSYSKIRFSPGVKELTKAERAQFNLALGEWAKCEFTLTQQDKSPD